MVALLLLMPGSGSATLEQRRCLLRHAHLGEAHPGVRCSYLSAKATSTENVHPSDKMKWYIYTCIVSHTLLLYLSAKMINNTQQNPSLPLHLFRSSSLRLFLCFEPN